MGTQLAHQAVLTRQQFLIFIYNKLWRRNLFGARHEQKGKYNRLFAQSTLISRVEVCLFIAAADKEV